MPSWSDDSASRCQPRKAAHNCRSALAITLPIVQSVRVSDDDATEAQLLAVRTQVVEAQLWAAEHPEELLAIVTGAETGAQALKRLTDAPYGFTEFQAHHILDTLFRRLTRENVALLRDGLERLRRGDVTQIDWRP